MWKISNPKFASDKINKIYRLETSPWAGHRNFVYDLVAFMKPGNILELGTHFGCSFFAFAQSIKDNKLDTELTAIDNWEGDEHAGFYGQEVFNIVQETVKSEFKSLKIKLIRDWFDKGLKKIADNSMDVIHIDGLHTYEAVNKDFNDALPKLAENGLVLFHDTNPEKDYGSKKFWQEISHEYPHYQFSHSWGLGILFPKGDKWYKLLEEINFQDKIEIYKNKAKYQLAKFQVEDLTQLVEEKDKGIASQTKLINERDIVIKELNKILKEKDKIISNQTRLINKKDGAIQSQSKMIDERDRAIKAITKLVDEKDEGIKSQTKMIDERDAHIVLLKNELDRFNSAKIIKTLKRLKLLPRKDVK